MALEGADATWGKFGGRDTYVGFEFDGVGQLKYGRQLVAAYDYVDWPHTNPGLGNVYDWHNAIGTGLRQIVLIILFVLILLTGMVLTSRQL